MASKSSLIEKNISYLFFLLQKAIFSNYLKNKEKIGFPKNYSTNIKSLKIFWKSEAYSIRSYIHFNILSNNYWEKFKLSYGTDTVREQIGWKCSNI